MKRRTLLLGATGLAIAVVITLVLVMRWLDVVARQRLEAALTDALGRQVTIGRMDVDVAGRTVELTDIWVANPPTVTGAPLFAAERLTFETSLTDLLTRRIVAKVRARGMEVRIVRYDEGTNLDGLLPARVDDPAAQ
jgi:hypothetical protein